MEIKATRPTVRVFDEAGAKDWVWWSDAYWAENRPDVMPSEEDIAMARRLLGTESDTADLLPGAALCVHLPRHHHYTPAEGGAFCVCGTLFDDRIHDYDPASAAYARRGARWGEYIERGYTRSHGGG